MRALYFRDAIGIEHQAIAALQLQLRLFVGPLGKQTQHSAADSKFRGRAISTNEQRRIVSCVAVAQVARLGVDHGEEE